jgi:dolichol-phosphate mannosyltransferase
MTEENKKLLSIIVPTYNEEQGIEEFYKRTKAVLVNLEKKFSHEIIFINDFSTDQTYAKLVELASKDDHVKIINFSRNFGNQIAITAGIDISQGDLAVIIDDDLQDPPELIPSFIKKWEEGYKVVYGVRPNRKGVNPLFRYSAKLYYKIIGNLSETKIPKDTGDFRLIDKAVMEVLRNMREESRYYRGMVAWVGFSQIGIEYDRDPRYAGKSTFSPLKYLRFAINGLTSFTEKPLYFSSVLGMVITLISFGFLITLIAKKLLDPEFSIPGWPSLITLVLFFGGIQLLSIGVVSIYISKIFKEVKKRPLYIISDKINIK